MLTGLVTSCVGIVWNEREGRIEVIGRQDICSCWMTLKRKEDTGN